MLACVGEVYRISGVHTGPDGFFLQRNYWWLGVCDVFFFFTFYAPFTRGREQVHIYFVPTNILKIRNTSLRQNGFTNDLHKNEFCSCFMNEAQEVFLLVFLLTYIVGSRSWFWEQCCWTWLWKSTDMNSVILMMQHTFLIWCSPWYEMMMNWFLRADESPGPSFINSAYAQMCA